MSYKGLIRLPETISDFYKEFCISLYKKNATHHYLFFFILYGHLTELLDIKYNIASNKKEILGDMTFKYCIALNKKQMFFFQISIRDINL